MTPSFCHRHNVQNGLSYLGKETRPTLCKTTPSDQLGVRSKERNKEQLFHRIASIKTPLIYNNLHPRIEVNRLTDHVICDAIKVYPFQCTRASMHKSKSVGISTLYWLSREDIKQIWNALFYNGIKSVVLNLPTFCGIKYLLWSSCHVLEAIDRWWQMWCWIRFHLMKISITIVSTSDLSTLSTLFM